MGALSPTLNAGPRSDGDGRSADRRGRILVAVHADDRRDPDGSGIQHVQAHQRGAPESKTNWERAWEQQPNREWRERIVGTESEVKDNDHGYRSRSKTSTASGRYQITDETLREAGWKDKTTGKWTETAKSFGVTSEEDFLVNENAQEEALDDVLRAYDTVSALRKPLTLPSLPRRAPPSPAPRERGSSADRTFRPLSRGAGEGQGEGVPRVGAKRNWYERQLVNRGAMQSAGQSIKALDGTEIPVTVSGLVAASHREGIQKVRDYLDHRAQGLPPPESIPNIRGNLSKFNEIGRRLREFATVPYRRLFP